MQKVEEVRVPIAAGAGSPELPDWAPLRENVADYVPHRTLKRAEASTTSGEDVYYLTFDTDTRPTGWAVDRLIGDGVSYVTGHVTPLHPSVQPMAAVVVTLYAAAAVERGWPHDDQSLQRATDIERRMSDMLTALRAANDKANQGDGTTPDPSNLLPVYSFPTPVPWGDDLL